MNQRDSFASLNEVKTISRGDSVEMLKFMDIETEFDAKFRLFFKFKIVEMTLQLTVVF